MKTYLYAILICLTLFFVTACTPEETMPLTDTVSLPEATEVPTSPQSYTGTVDFYHYKGLGRMTISADAPLDISLWINDHPLEMTSLNTSPIEMSISPYTVDGENQLRYTYVSDEPIQLHTSFDYPTLSEAGSSDAFTHEELDQLSTFMEQAIADDFPGAVLLIAHKGQVVYDQAFGYKQIYNGLEPLAQKIPMTNDTLFDLASLTKAYAGALSAMTLVDTGAVNLNTEIQTILPAYPDNITLGHLLSHTSGLPNYFRFFDPDNPLGETFYSTHRETTMNLIPQLDLVYTPGARDAYSDIGYMGLTQVIETLGQKSLDTYVQSSVYNPLGLDHIGYKPLDHFSTDMIAATERLGNTRDLRYEWPGVRTYTLRGEVHDELCYYSMDQISAHAGLFADAMDLAILSQMLLNGGGYGDTQVYSRETVKAFTSPSQYTSRYGYGFDMASNLRNYYRYGLLTSDQAYGKTGWTGTLALVDPAYDLVVVLLTNKRHATIENGHFTTDDMEAARYGSIITRIYELLLDQACDTLAITPTDTPNYDSGTALGIDQFTSSLYQDMRTGLICNTTSMTSSGLTTLDLFADRTDLSAVFAPEHGLEALIEAGGQVLDAAYKDLSVYSLYGNIKKPTSAMLDQIDILAFDIQDVGCRYYTYIYTMIYAMEACALADIPFVVYDRPTIHGKQVFGNAMDPDYHSFIGDYGLHQVYGLTIGELAMYINDTYGIGCTLTVVPMTGYHYEYFRDTGLDFIPPSPNMKSLDTALLYPGTCLIEGSNVSEGRGTDTPFQTIGAPFINPYRLADALNGLNLDGVDFIPTSFIPESSKYQDLLCYGVYIQITDPYVLDPITLGVSLLWTLQELYGTEISYRDHLNALCGFDIISVLEDIDPNQDGLDSLLEQFQSHKDYQWAIEPYKLYD